MNNEHTDLVTVCVPVFNGAKYLEPCIASIVSQSYQNIEIVISDNCSTDLTPQIIKRYQSKDNRILYFKNDYNIGYVRNVMAAVTHAHSEYVAIYHADDIYDQTIIEKEHKVLKTVPNVGGVFSKMLAFHGIVKKEMEPSVYHDLELKNIYKKSHNIFEGGFIDFSAVLLEMGNIFACPSFMTYKKIFLELGGFTDKYPTNEDLELWIKYLKSGWRLAIVNECLLNYRHSESQGSFRSEIELGLNKMFDVLEDMVVSHPDVNGTEKSAFYRMKSWALMRESYKAYALGERKRSLDFLSESRSCHSENIFSFRWLMKSIPALYYILKKSKI